MRMFLLIIYVLCLSQVWAFLRFSPRLSPRSKYWKVNGAMVSGLAVLLLLWFQTPFSDLTDERHHDPSFWWSRPALMFFLAAFPYFLLMAGVRHLIWKWTAEPGASPNGGPVKPPRNLEVTEGPPSVS